MNDGKRMENFLEAVDCNLCGANDYQTKFRPVRADVDPSRIFSASGSVMGTQHIVKCNRCGLVYVQPRIRSKIIKSAYESSTDELYVSQAAARLNTFKTYIRLVERFAPDKGRILDVGAAAGFFMRAAQENGWDVYGVELSRWLAEYGNREFGFDIRQGSLQEAEFPGDYFDAVTMWDVLEHTSDPFQELREAWRVLKAGGLLVINYPDIGTAMARAAGSRWWFLLSGHLFYFDRKTIGRMLRNAGFDVLKSKRHYQEMEIGHLAKMLALYSGSLSSMAARLFRATGLEQAHIRYYAGQTNVLAKKAAS